VRAQARTVVVVIDPYNDFTSRFGKGWLLIREVAHEVRLIDNLKLVLAEARRRNIPVVYARHARYRRGSGRRVPFPNPSSISCA